jgi:transposase-like protein
MFKKSCKKCESFRIKKDGKMRGKQRYKCLSCGYVFQNASREQELREQYTKGKQTYQQLSATYGLSVYKVRKLLDNATVQQEIVEIKGKVVVTLDTTYFGRAYGIMVFRSEKLQKNLLWKMVIYETKALYQQGIAELQRQGWVVQAIVCDGKKGVLGRFEDIPTQKCVFHQMKTVRAYLGKYPR